MGLVVNLKGVDGIIIARKLVDCLIKRVKRQSLRLDKLDINVDMNVY